MVTVIHDGLRAPRLPYPPGHSGRECDSHAICRRASVITVSTGSTQQAVHLLVSKSLIVLSELSAFWSVFRHVMIQQERRQGDSEAQ